MVNAMGLPNPVVEAFRLRTTKPLLVKLPQFVSETERDVVLDLAAIAQEAGVDGLTCSNSRLVDTPGLAAGRGGLSGRALWPRTLQIVADVRAAAGSAIAINACGGISTADDVAACLDAGATTVQIYSALVYEGPGVLGQLTSGLAGRSGPARGGGSG
jgi:dihydroorotate dehydrogenase